MTEQIFLSIAKMDTADKLKNVMDNAQAKNRDDVYWAAFKRLCDVKGDAYIDEPLSRDFYKMLAAYEALLREKNGRNQPASRTRQKLDRLGIKKCLEDWALAKKATPGFTLLLEKNMPEYTAEAVVLTHASFFSAEVIDAARNRLQEHGVDVNTIQM